VLNDSVDKFTSGVYTRYEFLPVVGHTADSLRSEQLDDVDDSEDDSPETYDAKR